jgi:hypothetical protein
MNPTEAAADSGVGLIGRALKGPVAVDDFGTLVLLGESSDLDPQRVVMGCCSIAGRAFGTSYEAVSAKVAAVDGDHIALVTVSEHIRGRVHFNGATATASHTSEAVLIAATRALGLDGGILVGVARRWQGRPGVLALSVHGSGALQHGAEEFVAMHGRLLELVPRPGRLMVTTESAEHRLLVLPEAAAIVTMSCRSMVIGEIERAFEAIEADHQR